MTLDDPIESSKFYFSLQKRMKREKICYFELDVGISVYLIITFRFSVCMASDGFTFSFSSSTRRSSSVSVSSRATSKARDSRRQKKRGKIRPGR